MKRTSWGWLSVGVLTALAVGFLGGGYVGLQYTTMYYLRHNAALYGPDHDEFVLLEKNGSKDDIPMLLYGLSQQTQKDVCTYQHCVDALRALSGANPGDTYDAWTNWWITEMKKPVPDWHPTYRLIKWKKGLQKDASTNESQQIAPVTNRGPSAAAFRH